MADAVNHPKHYIEQSAEGFEPIDLIERLPTSLGNALKYMIRAGHKDAEIQDLRKARWYLLRSLEKNVFPVAPVSVCQGKGSYEDIVTAFARKNEFCMTIFKDTLKGIGREIHSQDVAATLRLVDDRIDQLFTERLRND